MTYKPLLIAPVLVAVLAMIGATQYANSQPQQTTSDSYNIGWTDGEAQAASDFNAGNTTPQQQCSGHHSDSYCRGYWNGYGDEWNRSIQANSNTNPQPEQSSPGPNYSGVCQTVQPVLIQSCSTLVNGDGSLTTDGTHAMNCIKNGVLLGGGATLLGLPLPLVLKGLSILSAPTGCDGIVDMSAFNLLNIGSISSLLNSLP
jgi:hypothetical protein